MNFMNTYTGRTLNPMDMCMDDISIEDIGHALSLLCRGGGHLKYFYSVAQHSINCANEAKARGWSKRVVLACLLHDASEAYISDIIRPVKQHLTNYMEIEIKIMNVILEKYNLHDLSFDENKMWKQIDDIMLIYELESLMNSKNTNSLPILYSKPNFSKRDNQEVECEFISMINELISYTL